MLWGLLWLPWAALVVSVQDWRLRLPVPPEQKLPLVLLLYGWVPVPLWLLGWLPVATRSGLVHLGWEVVKGYIVALTGIALLVGLQLLGGWKQWQPPRTLQPLTVGALVLVTLAIGGVEELVFRGVVVDQLQPLWPWGSVLLGSSLVFALLHLVWDGTTGVPQLPGLVVMGAVLLIARWVDGLGLAWGLHSGWIGALALIDTLQMLQPQQGPFWLLGRPQQPLTGLLDLALLVGTGGLLWGVWQLGLDSGIP